MFEESVTIRRSLYHRVLMAAVLVLAQDLSSRWGAQAWTYTYSDGPNRKWSDARLWCQANFIDLAMARNQEEMDFLNNLLPFYEKYYWIGVHRVAGVWTWAGINENVPEEAQNWAPNEPDSIPGQDCVEIYIKREPGVARWNNEKCKNKKRSVCYSASCMPGSCGARADCVETVGNYTCQCHPGFTGPRCEETVACKPLAVPKQGFYYCSDPYGPGRFNSSCRYDCELGFRLVGTPQLLCQADGSWDHPAPLCHVEQCPAVNHTSISGGRMTCSHPIARYSYNSTCEVKCDDGHELGGQGHMLCDHTGRWTASVPSCTVKKCSPIFFADTGNVTCVDTVEPFSFGSRCNFTCKEGYILSGDGSLACLATGRWSKPAPTCTVVQCSHVTAPPAASVQCQHPLGLHSYSSVCAVRCKEGFDLIGTNVTTCSSRGNWSHALPVCQAKRCPPLSSPPHGSMFCSDPHEEFSFGSQCTSGCDEGFVLNGTADTECSSLGVWSRGTPDCLARFCPLLVEAPQHGMMNCSHPFSPFSYGSRCDFKCEEGFWLRGLSATMCNSSGLWSQNAPTCQPVKCKPIGASSSPLSVNCSHPLGNFSFGSRCAFVCADGFSLNGSDVLLCSSRGLWNDSLPTCTSWPVGTSMLLYTGVGAASAFIPLALIGLAVLILTRMRHKNRDTAIIPEVPVSEARENPAFEP